MTRVYYRGSNPASSARISTGVPEWDDNLFVTRDERYARDYGPRVEVIEVSPDAHVLVEGPGGFGRVARKRRGERFMDYALRALRGAANSGYDVIEFALQGSVGTVIINPDVIVARYSKAVGGKRRSPRAGLLRAARALKDVMR